MDATPVDVLQAGRKELLEKLGALKSLEKIMRNELEKNLERQASVISQLRSFDSVIGSLESK